MTATLLTSNTLIAFGAFVWLALSALDKLNLLPRRRSAVDAEAELVISGRVAERLRDERDKLRKEVAKLEATRSMEPILERIEESTRNQAENNRLQAQVLDRLAHHNGSFAHMEKSLSLIEDGLQTLTGFISELAGLDVKPPIRRKEPTP